MQPPHAPLEPRRSLFVQQVVALVKKDFLVLRTHRRAMISELVFPLLMGTLACLFLSQFLNMSGYVGSGYTEEYCFSNGFTAYAPSNFSNATAVFDGPFSYCTSTYGMKVYDNLTGMLDAYQSFVQQQADHNTITDWSVGAIMWYQNNSRPRRDVNVFAVNQLAAYQGMPIGKGLYWMYNPEALLPTSTSVNFKEKISNGGLQQYNIRQTFATAGAIMLAFTFLPMASTMAGRLVDEKKAKVREHLRVMGVSSLAYLLAAFIVAMLRVGFVSISLLVLIGAFNIVDVTCLFGVWISLVCYGFSLAGYAQIMPAFFSKPTMSNAACSLFISLTSIGAVFASQITQLPPLLGFLFSPSAFIYAAASLLNNNFAQLSLSPGGAIGCLVWQMVMYAALSQYLYSINPGEFGVPRPLLFPLYDALDLCGIPHAHSSKRHHLHHTGRRGNNDDAQALRAVATPGATPTAKSNGSSDRIVLEGLVKVFGNDVDNPAVNKLSLRVREQEIFALLGHNGAGKTTTISMLIGMLASTSYDVAEVLGYDLNSDLDYIRRHIGICPQFDVLFDDLSARQHLDLYAAVKGKPLADGDALLRKLKLPLDDQKSSTFSGGMKRRLSVGNALVGDAPIIFLDEPSSGLDPVSRRQLWDLLREERDLKGKSIVLTTHFMEEADYLGNRIAIMSHGRLYCCDTSANLKAQYGVGYYLNFSKKTVAGSEGSNSPNVVMGHPMLREDHPSAAVVAVVPPSGSSNHHHGNVFHVALAAEILNRYTADWKLHRESVGDVTFLLPPSALPRFGDLLQEVEANMDALGAQSYGISMNTLEDVFVNISEREAAAAAKAAGKEVVDARTLNTRTTRSGIPVETLFADDSQPFFMRTLSQTWTMYVKKAMMLRRSARLVVTAIVVPLILLAIGYAAAIPNFNNRSSGGGGGNSYSWSSFYSGAAWPDAADVGTIFVMQDSDTWSPALLEVLETFTTMYADVEAYNGNANPGVSFQLVSQSEFSVGAFLGGGSISFLQTYNPVLQMRFYNDFNTQFLDGQFPNATVTYYYEDQMWAGLYLATISSIMNAAVQSVWAKHNAQTWTTAVPIGILHSLPVPSYNISGSTPAPSTPAPADSSSSSSEFGGNSEFILIPLAVLINVGLGQLCAGIILPVADEMNRRVFHTLRLHGCTAAAYWLGTFLFDLTTAGTMVVGYIIGAYARGVTQIQNDLLVYQCLILVLCSASAILMSYVIVLVLPENLKPSTYLYAATGIYYLTLVIPMIIYVALLLGGAEVPAWFPAVTPSRALMAAISASPNPPSEIWSGTLCRSSFIGCFIWLLVWVVIIVYKSYISPRRSVKSSTPAPLPPTSSRNAAEQPLMVCATPSSPMSAHTQYGAVVGHVVRDVDVEQEVQRVEGRVGDNLAACLHLRKVYHGVSTVGSADRSQSFVSSVFGAEKDKVAVSDLTLGIRAGECFGLLGPNGAGKTTTVKMLMRELAPSAGAVLFPYAPDASNVDTGPLGAMDNAYREARLGVCQQGDTLWENFSAREHMETYLRVRLGSLYEASEFSEYIDNAIQKVYLEEAREKYAGNFSGGMKRKLAVCIAMYTGARTMFLDEPSTGMDPFARRALWSSINEALEDDRCVLLTTHAMEEADSVCARIGIVTNGVMQCIGNSQHLKNRFGSGFSVVVTLLPRDGNGVAVAVANAKDAEEAAGLQLLIDSPAAQERTKQASLQVDRAILDMFGKGCELKEVLGLQRRYAVPRIPTLSFAFRSLESQRDALGIANYSIQQLTSLEQIFINFAGAAANEGN